MPWLDATSCPSLMYVGPSSSKASRTARGPASGFPCARAIPAPAAPFTPTQPVRRTRRPVREPSMAPTPSTPTASHTASDPLDADDKAAHGAATAISAAAPTPGTPTGHSLHEIV